MESWRKEEGKGKKEWMSSLRGSCFNWVDYGAKAKQELFQEQWLKSSSNSHVIRRIKRSITFRWKYLTFLFLVLTQLQILIKFIQNSAMLDAT